MDSKVHIDVFFENLHEKYKLDPDFDGGEFVLNHIWESQIIDIPVIESASMPEQSKQQDLAYHIFSVLSMEGFCNHNADLAGVSFPGH